VTREDSVNYRITGMVRSIADGDSVTLTGRRNARFVIRLSDLDTPETSHQPFTPRDCKCAPVPFRPGQAGGQQATEGLRSLLAIGEEVTPLNATSLTITAARSVTCSRGA
jgi:endonuclease YncB( thermonuclease family)